MAGKMDMKAEPQSGGERRGQVCFSISIRICIAQLHPEIILTQ